MKTTSSWVALVAWLCLIQAGIASAAGDLLQTLPGPTADKADKFDEKRDPAAVTSRRSAAGRVKTRRTPTTRVYVETDPSGANVFVDGKRLGASDDLFTVPDGVSKLTLEVKLDGHYPETQQVIVRGGEITRVVLDLRKRPPPEKGAVSRPDATKTGGKVPKPEAAVLFDEDARGNWPRFRGPGGLGISSFDNVPTAWNATSGEGIIWRTAVPLPGKNSPIVWGGRVFLSGADHTRRQVYCFSAWSGKLLWAKDVSVRPEHASDPPEILEETGYAAPSLTTDGHRVFAIFASGDVAALSLSGDLEWARSLGVPDNVYGHASSPITYGTLLLIQFDQGSSAKEGKSNLLALDAASGETVYQISRPVPNSWASPSLIRTDKGDQLITCADPWVIAYNPADGREIWRANCLEADVGPSPVFSGGLVHAGNEYSRWSAIRPDGKGDVSETHVCWTAEEGLPELCSPLAAQGHLFLLTTWGMLTCYDAATGELLWDRDFDASFTASPAWAGGRVYLFANDGKGWIVEPSRDRCTVLTQTDLDQDCFASPAFQAGRIYVRGSEHLFCLGDKDDLSQPAGRTSSGETDSHPVSGVRVLDAETTKPLGGCWLTFGGWGRIVYTDENGIYRGEENDFVRRLAGGDTLYVQHPDYQSLSEKAAGLDSVDGLVTAYLTKEGNASLTVNVSLTVRGAKKNAPCRVCLLDGHQERRGREIRRIEHSEDRVYRFSGLAPGDYTIEAYFWSSYPTHYEPIHLAATETKVVQIDSITDEIARIRVEGVVLDQRTGRPVEGLCFHFCGAPDDNVFTDKDGRFSAVGDRSRFHQTYLLKDGKLVFWARMDNHMPEESARKLEFHIDPTHSDVRASDEDGDGVFCDGRNCAICKRKR